MLADRLQRPLYELRPDVFPEGFLTGRELELWSLYFEEMEARRTHG